MIIGFYNGVPGVKAIHKKASPQNSRDNLQQVEIRRFSLSTLRTRLKRKNKNIGDIRDKYAFEGGKKKKKKKHVSIE